MNESLGTFIEIYPRKDDEAAIFLEWNRQVRNQQTIDDIVEGTRAWVAYWQVDLTPTQFIPKPTAFLRSKQYLDLPSNGKDKKVWLGSPQPHPYRWSANWPIEPPLPTPKYEPPEGPRKGFRPAADILAARRASRGS